MRSRCSASAREPTSLVLPERASLCALGEKTGAAEPKALFFPRAACRPEAARAEAPFSGKSSSDRRGLSEEPRALVFSENVAGIAATSRSASTGAPVKACASKQGRVPRVAFEAESHPLLAQAHAKATELAGSGGPTGEPSLLRLLGQLLPLRTPVVEAFGEKSLDNCRHHVQRVATLTQRHARLNIAQLLADAVRPSDEPGGARRLWSRLTGEVLVPAAVRLDQARPHLVNVLQEARELGGPGHSQGERLSLSLLALRSVAEVSGTGADPLLRQVLGLRLETLRTAVAQASLARAQLQSLESTAALQLAELDRIAMVTLSARALGTALETGPRAL